jgi:glycosyltransferase domain-containing protein
VAVPESTPDDHLNQVTIVVPLKDNVEKTAHFLRHSLLNQPRFLFADGSLGDANQLLLQDRLPPNSTYFRYPPDVSLNAFLTKMASASQLISTPFAMTMDAGDFLLPRGLRSAAESLGNNLRASCVDADSYFVREFRNHLTPARLASTSKPVSGSSIESALDAIKTRYSHIWYALFKSEVFQRTWTLAERENVTHPFLEYMPTLIALHSGIILHSPDPWIVRVVHGPRSWTVQSPDFNVNYEDNGEELERFAAMIQKATGTDAATIVDAFRSNVRVVQGHVRLHAETSPYGIGLRRLRVLGRVPWLANRRILSHYAGYWVNPRGEGFRLGNLGITLDALRWRNRDQVLSAVAPHNK